METTTKIIEKVEIKNLRDWPLYFKRFTELGECKLDPPKQFPDYLSLEELKAQIRKDNRLFIGVDGRGNHAAIAIVDDDVRRELFHIEKGEVTTLLTLDEVRDLLAISNQDKFAKRLNELVVTDGERRMLPKLAEKAGIDNTAAWKGKLIDSLFEQRENPMLSEKFDLHR